MITWRTVRRAVPVRAGICEATLFSQVVNEQVVLAADVVSPTSQPIAFWPQTPGEGGRHTFTTNSLDRDTRESFRHELVAVIAWYNEYRPHATLAGKTPLEAYEGRFPANRRARIEPRLRWPRGSPCAKPWALVAGKPGQRLAATVTFHAKRRHLPIVTLERAA